MKQGKDGKLPDEELLYKAAFMDIDLENEDEYSALLFFWDVAAPAVLGNHSWGDTTRPKRIMMDAYVGDGTDYPLFTPSNMAFTLLQLENGYNKFHVMAKWKMDHPGEKHLPKPAPKAEREALEKKLEKNPKTPIPFLHQMHRARHTYSNGGRNDFGGWKLAGKIRQRDLTKAIKKRFRANAKEIRRLQGAFLEKWNREMAEADGDISKKRKAAAAKETKKKQKLEQAFDVGGWGESDDSDEESDIGSESEGDS